MEWTSCLHSWWEIAHTNQMCMFIIVYEREREIMVFFREYQQFKLIIQIEVKQTTIVINSVKCEILLQVRLATDTQWQNVEFPICQFYAKRNTIYNLLINWKNFNKAWRRESVAQMLNWTHFFIRNSIVSNWKLYTHRAQSKCSIEQQNY